MSSNSSEPLVPNPTEAATTDNGVPVPTGEGPDYEKLARFLVEPFLEVTDTLRVDCEISANRQRVWVRVAFEGADRGRVFGRGGRNIQAVRTVLKATAALVNQVAHLDVYGPAPDDGVAATPRRNTSAPTSRPRPSRPRRRGE